MNKQRPDISSLDPGIRDVVKALWDANIETTDSGDGVSKPEMGCAIQAEHVACRPSPALGFNSTARAIVRLLAKVRPGQHWQVEATTIYYTPTHGCRPAGPAKDRMLSHPVLAAQAS